MITSPSNPRIKRLRQLIREGCPDSENRIPVEGVKLVGEALRSRLEISEIYVSGNRMKETPIQAILREAERTGTKSIPVTDKVFDRLADTESPQGIVALVQLPQFQLDQVTGYSSLVVVAHLLQDPGNLGTLIRSSEAFGANGVLLTHNTVSPFNPKAIRAAAGSLFRMPVLHEFDLYRLMETLREQRFKLVAATPQGDRDFRKVDYRGSVALFVGNEGTGLPSEVLDRIDLKVRIPLSAPVESLNVAIASSIILCEATRQRSQQKERIQITHGTSFK